MRFEENRNIFQQIADQFCWDIMQEKWQENERLPSIRETAVELQVNPNTVMKSFAELEDLQIIYKQRGMGYYVAPGAREKILQIRKHDFFNNELPKLFKTLKMLELSPEELTELYRKYLGDNKPS